MSETPVCFSALRYLEPDYLKRMFENIFHNEHLPIKYTEIFFSRRRNFKVHGENFDCFDIFAQNIDCGYTLEPPRPGGRGSSNKYPQSMFWSKDTCKNTQSRYILQRCNGLERILVIKCSILTIT